MGERVVGFVSSRKAFRSTRRHLRGDVHSNPITSQSDARLVEV